MIKKYWLIKNNEIVNIVYVDPERIRLRPEEVHSREDWLLPAGCELEECLEADQRDDEKRRDIGMVRSRKGEKFATPADAGQQERNA